MARGNMFISSGTIAAAGSGNRALLYDTVIAQIKGPQSGGVDAWKEFIDSSTPGSRSQVFHSVGDRTLGAGGTIGDTDLWIRIQEGSTQHTLRAYSDYSTSSHSGSRVTNARNFGVSTLSDTTQYDWWCVANEYEFWFVFVFGGAWNWFGWASPKRDYLSPAIEGVARVATDTVGTGTVVVALDRDISSKIVADPSTGQFVWIKQVTAEGTALETFQLELVRVSAVTANSITLLLVANSGYVEGSLVGIDPAPFFSFGTFVGADPAWYFTDEFDGTYVSATVQTGGIVNDRLSISEPDQDPGPLGALLGLESGALMDTPKAMRGNLDGIIFVATGTQADNDRMLNDYNDTDQGWKIFPSLTPVVGWSVAIGPGIDMGVGFP